MGKAELKNDSMITLLQCQLDELESSKTHVHTFAYTTCIQNYSLNNNHNDIIHKKKFLSYVDCFEYMI